MLRKEYLICIEVYKKLSDKVTGKVITTIQNNDMIVTIINRKGVRYCYTYKCISMEMIGGRANYDKITNIIFNNYKQFIQKVYFKEV